MSMKKGKQTKTKESRVSEAERKRILDNIPKASKECASWGLWGVCFRDTKEEQFRLVEEEIGSLRDKRKRYFITNICGSTIAPLSMALATFACTLPHIKRVYICERKDHLDMINTIVKHEGFPLITKRVKNLIPYEVLRVLGKGKVLFIKHNNLRKFELFIEDDLKIHKFCKYFPATVAGQDRALGKAYQKYKAEWISDDEVVIS